MTTYDCCRHCIENVNCNFPGDGGHSVPCEHGCNDNEGSVAS